MKKIFLFLLIMAFFSNSMKAEQVDGYIIN